MLHRTQELIGLDIVAEGGRIGTIADLLFDDQKWTVRYLVVDTGNWLAGRKVLLSPLSLSESESEDKVYLVNLTRREIENSPPISADEPVSRQNEIDLHTYYQLNPSFSGARGPLGEPVDPIGQAEADQDDNSPGPDNAKPDPHLRSAEEVAGYHIQASEGEIGHVEDFFVDGKSWDVRYVVIDTRNWLPGKKVVLATAWIEGVSWDGSRVSVSVTRETVKNSPEYIPTSPMTREYEKKLFEYYQKPTYWE